MIQDHLKVPLCTSVYSVVEAFSRRQYATMSVLILQTNATYFQSGNRGRRPGWADRRL